MIQWVLNEPQTVSQSVLVVSDSLTAHLKMFRLLIVVNDIYTNNILYLCM